MSPSVALGIVVVSECQCRCVLCVQFCIVIRKDLLAFVNGVIAPIFDMTNVITRHLPGYRCMGWNKPSWLLLPIWR